MKRPSYEPSPGHLYRFTEYEETYDGGVAEAQALIERHPNGFPSMTMAQYGVEWDEDPYTRVHQEGWYDRLADWSAQRMNRPSPGVRRWRPTGYGLAHCDPNCDPAGCSDSAKWPLTWRGRRF